MTVQPAAPTPLVPETGQLTKAHVQKLYKAGRYEDIEEARIAGRLNDVLAGRSAQPKA